MKYFVPVCLFFILVLTSCPSDSSGSSILPTKTIRWEDDRNGYTQFYTNDTQYYEMSFWMYFSATNITDVYHVECRKISGSHYYGYGLIMRSSSEEKFYRIEIASDGSYRYSKFDETKPEGSRFSTIRTWEESSHINKGNNKLNRIRAVKDNGYAGPGVKYSVYLNNQKVDDFIDDSEPITTARIGFSVTVGDEEYESFPNTPVDVRFKRITP